MWMDHTWPSYAPEWPSYAPLWRLRADLFKKRPKSLKNASFSWFFYQGVEIGCKSRKTGCYVFCLFTPLYWRFRLSHALQVIDLEEIQRLVPKIVNFMPCGSVSEILMTIYGNSNEFLSKFFWNSKEILLKCYRNSIEILLKFYWNSIEIL